MPAELTPEIVLNHLKRGGLGSVYLFYGPDDFLLEKVLNQIRETFLPESARDFNLHIFDGDGSINPGDILDAARSMPFLSSNRLVIVRRTDRIASVNLEAFLPYLEKPVNSTCLIFVALKPDFRLKFFNFSKKLGYAVNFKELNDRQVLPWIKATARELGLNINMEACRHLQEIVGNGSRTLHMELEKLYLRHGSKGIGIAEIKELSIFSRMFTIFELMDEISHRRKAQSLSILNRYLEEEGRDAAFGIIGMLTRQIRIIFQAKVFTSERISQGELAKKLGVPGFLINKILDQARNWREEDLEKALVLLYQADGRLKSGSQAHLILENFVLSL